jgi:hypothetical protein
MANRAWWAAAVASMIGAGLFPRAARAADTGEGSATTGDDRTLVALAVALACAEVPEAEAHAPPAQAAAPANDGPEIELVATVRAKALRFEVVPRTQVALEVAGKRKTVWKTERVNLPVHPQPGVVYRDVAVRLTVTGGVEELAALLKEAKRASAGIVLGQDAPAAPSAPAAMDAPGSSGSRAALSASGGTP